MGHIMRLVLCTLYVWSHRLTSIKQIATETLPLPSAENGVEVMTAVHNHWKTASAPISHKIFGAVASIAYQPVPRLISQQTRKHGGNVMDMDDDGHRIILEYDYSYINGYAENEVAVDKATNNLVGGTREIIQKFIQENKVKWNESHVLCCAY
jgi:hypothetical protein